MRSPMHEHSQVFHRIVPSFGKGVAAALVALAALAGATAAHAATPETAAASSGTAAPQSTAAPRAAASGFVIVGPVTATWEVGKGITIDAAAVVNNNTSKNGSLGLHLWVTPAGDGTPVISPLIDFQDLGGIDLGILLAGKQKTNIAQSGLTYTPPKPGCYYVMLALLNETVLADLYPLSSGAGGFPTSGGYDLFAFGKNTTTCAQTTSCPQSALDGCLIGGRFQVTATYYNATSGSAQGQVLSFNGTRAESDESVFYYFTDSSNFEMGVKILDACTLNNFFWVFIGGLTNQGWTVNILDTKTGNTKSYTNNLPLTTVTTTDTAALPCP
jgi:hypothetical protein